MTTHQITFISVGSLVAVNLVLRLLDYLALKRMRSLTCPQCGEHFGVVGLKGTKRWMIHGFDGQKSSVQHGFTLECKHCLKEFRFNDNGEPSPKDEERES